MLNRFEAGLVIANRFALIALLATMACIVFANVVLRYTTGYSLIWAEEVSRHLMIWGTFLGAGLALRFGGHVAIDNLHQAMGNSVARLLRTVVAVGILVFSTLMGYFAIQYMGLMRFQTTPATGISFAYVYAALPIGFALIVIHFLLIVRGYVATGVYIESEEMNAEAAAAI